MKLSVKERMMVGALYPQEGDLMTQILVRDIAKRVEISPKESKSINIRRTNDGLEWNSKKAKVKDIEFSESELVFLKEQVTRLDKQKKITQSILDLCLKIRNA